MIVKNDEMLIACRLWRHGGWSRALQNELPILMPLCCCVLLPRNVQEAAKSAPRGIAVRSISGQKGNGEGEATAGQQIRGKIQGGSADLASVSLHGLAALSTEIAKEAASQKREAHRDLEVTMLLHTGNMLLAPDIPIDDHHLIRFCAPFSHGPASVASLMTAHMGGAVFDALLHRKWHPPSGCGSATSRRHRFGGGSWTRCRRSWRPSSPLASRQVRLSWPMQRTQSSLVTHAGTTAFLLSIHTNQRLVEVGMTDG